MVCRYELLTGVCPFAGDSPEEIFEKAVEEQEVWPPDDIFEEGGRPSEEVKDLVGWLLKKDPAQRLPIPNDMLAEDALSTYIGVDQIKMHPFFNLRFAGESGELEPSIDWDRLLEEKACFVPELEGELDTRYFDDRKDRYQVSVE